MKTVIAKGKTIEEAIQKAVEQLDVPKENVKTKVLEIPSSGLMGLLGSKSAKVEVSVIDNYKQIAIDFINSILNSMGIKAQLIVTEEDKSISINMIGDDMGILIGRRGQTLDSLQYLTSLAVNKVTDEYIRVSLNTENYREKREKTLQDLAQSLAHKVSYTKTKFILEPMNPYERRIIHFALQDYPHITTYSEGEEPFRRVVIDYEQ